MCVVGGDGGKFFKSDAQLAEGAALKAPLCGKSNF
jgi:hypothetical protein